MEQIRRIRCGLVNCYIVQGDGAAILVDTGMEKYRQRLLEACRPFDIRLIVLTHGHLDHVQNAAYLSEALHAPIAMNQRDLPLLSDNMCQSLHAQTTAGRLMLAFSKRNFRRKRIPPLTPSVLLQDGDSLEAYGIPARVIALPGQLLGHDDAAMRASAARIGSLGTRILYFGHGRPARQQGG